MTEDEYLDIYYEQRQNAQDASVTFDRQYAKTFGINGGIFLSVLGRHCKPNATGGRVFDDGDGERWAYNTYEGWCEYCFEWLSPQALQKVILKLEKDGYVFSCQPDGTDKKKYYRPNRRKIIRAVANNYPWAFPLVQPDGLIEHDKTIRSNNTKSYDVNKNTVNTDNQNELLLQDDEKFSKNSENENPELAKVFKTYNDNIGFPSPLIRDDIVSLIEEGISPDWIIAAIKEAVSSEVRNWKYIAAILNRWKTQGFQSEKPESKSKPQAKSKAKPQTAGRYVPEHEESQTIVKGGTTYFIEGKNRLAGDDVELQF